MPDLNHRNIYHHTCLTKTIRSHSMVHNHSDTHTTIPDQKMDIPWTDKSRDTSRSSFLHLLRNIPSKLDYFCHQQCKRRRNLRKGIVWQTRYAYRYELSKELWSLFSSQKISLDIENSPYDFSLNKILHLLMLWAKTGNRNFVHRK